MRIVKYVLLVLFTTSYLHAQSINYAQFGIAFDAKTSGSYSDQKLVELGLQQHYKVFDVKYGIGGWADGSGYPGVKNSFYGQVLWGVEPRSEHCYVHYLFGPALISSPDSLLASNFQFSHELGFGFKDIRDVRVGIAIKHWSNAGICKPNYGRNFAVFEAAF